LCHLEQTHEQIELVPPRQPGEIGECLGNKEGRLVRIALAARFIIPRSLVPACGCARSPPPFLDQKLHPISCFLKNYSF
jgi:hypothetical protein